MARFDVYAIRKGGAPTYFLDVQSNTLSHLVSRVVVPLVPANKLAFSVRDLNPAFQIETERYAMLTQEIVTIETRRLKMRVTSVANRQDDIMRALDILLIGY